MLLGEVLRMAEDPHGSLDECRALLEAAPLAASGILRVGNSDLCGLPGRIHRLDRVVHILGVRSVAEIATWIQVEHSTRGGLERWDHALAVGTCARLLARHLELRCDLDAGLAGLLHVAEDAILERWGVGERLRGAVRHHTDPLRAPAPSRSAAALVHAAHLLVDARPDPEGFLPGLGMLPDDAEPVLATTRERCKQVRSVLG
jgi:HD-like signal output (HDOD) protein